MSTVSSPLAQAAEALEARKAKVREMGGSEAIARQKAAGKLTARERLDAFLDPGSFVEIGALATTPGTNPEMAGKETPADGVVTGTGRVDGRLVCVAAYDFTVMAGSIGMVGELKVARLRELALTQRIPMVWLLDSAGARIQEIASSQFAGTGALFYEQAIMSGVVPQVAAVMGPCAAGTAYVPALTDYVPMVKGTSSMALAGPPLVKAVIGEDVTAEDLGGSKVHCEVSGVGDGEFPDDVACLGAVRRYLGYLPSSCDEAPPVVAAREPEDPEGLAAVLPENPRQPYDMREVLRRVVDAESLFEIKPRFAQSVITAFARLGGRPVGVVASQPKVMAGVLTTDAADKAARFITLCDAFNIPLVFFQDVPGFMVGSKVEREGIIRHGAKMLYAVSNATVPKLTVIVRKAYGAGYYVMCGRGYKPDLLVAWPTAEISLMGPEGAVNIIHRKRIAEAEDPTAERAKLVDQYRSYIDPYVAAGAALIDDVIDPRETRSRLLSALELTRGKRQELPRRRHGVMPV